MKRRTLIRYLGAGAALSLGQGTGTAFAGGLDSGADTPGAPARLLLWNGQPPGGGGPTGPLERTAKGAVSRVAEPFLEVITPAKPNGSAALIAAGGGYKRIQMESEAYPAARWLAARGVTAFVLTYRLPGEGWTDGALAPLQDAQRAIRLVRARASQYGVDPARMFALGFSAGGHLMGLAAARPGFASYPARDELDRLPADVAAAALIYPVITLRPPYDRTSTRRVLVGQHPSPKESADWSVETWIRPHTPSLFAVQAQDDPIADPANIGILVQAARSAGIAIEAHTLPSGGHGFGMGKPGTPSAEWPTWFEPWLRQRGLIG
jgi:acetyl esterase/lipase